MKKILNTTIENIKNGNYSNVKKTLYIGLVIIVTGLIGNIILSLLTTDRSIFETPHHFKSAYLFIAACLALVPWITNTLRVLIWTRFLGYRISFAHLLRITIGTELGSALSPTAIGGGYVKAGMLMHKGLTVGKATSLLTLGSMENGLFFLLALPTAVYLAQCWDLPMIQQIMERFQQNMLTALLIVLAILIQREKTDGRCGLFTLTTQDRTTGYEINDRYSILDVYQQPIILHISLCPQLDQLQIFKE
ncbi:flippase-like domain-containing protein [candidate division KSB1 bacterium]|nr:flippase-like domain-containing protein [candidate division KSB1 bacterium]